MEVTRSNFKQLMPVVEEAIQNSCFICIDGEFTGLKVGKDVNSFDTPEEYYSNLAAGSCNFMLVQFGLCLFRWDSNARSYRHCAFNFYLFPRPYSKHAPDRTFYCQSSSMEFLASLGFDFNKLFCDGISYLSGTHEAKLRESIEERQKTNTQSVQNSNTNKEIIEIPLENKEYIDYLCNSISTFLEASEPEFFEIEKCNAFVRKLIYQEVRERFPEKAIVESKVLDNKDRVLVITRVVSKEDLLRKEKERNEKEFTDLEEAIGFSRVARCISESGKLVVGHNMILDVLHTLNQFFAPLPESYSEFKEFASCMFPKILDTKYMSRSPPFTVTCNALSPLLATLSEEPFGIPDTEPETRENLKGYSQTCEKAHEAGYDAYVTGLCLLSMYKHCLKLRGGEIYEVPLNVDSNLLKPYLNKLYLFKTAYQDSPYINLAGKDPKPSRDHVFHLTFPKEWTRSDINQLFSPFGNVHISYLDDTSAYVALLKKEQSYLVARKVRPSKLYKITPYKLYKTQPALPTFHQLHWKADKKSPPSTLKSPVDRKRKFDSQNSSSNGGISAGLNTLEQTDDGPLAPKRTPRAKTAPGGRVPALSGTFAVEDQPPKPDRRQVAEMEETSRKAEDSSDAEIDALAESVKWNAFEESDNWD